MTTPKSPEEFINAARQQMLYVSDAEEYQDDETICHACGDSFDCGDLEKTEVCNLCAQEWREECHPKELIQALQSQSDELAKLKRQLEVARGVLEESAIYASLSDECGCEAGNGWSQEFICGRHRLLNKIGDCLARIERIGEGR